MDSSNEPTDWIPTSFSSAPDTAEGDSLSSYHSATTPGSVAVDQQSDDQSFDALSRQKLNLTTTSSFSHGRSSPRVPGMSMFEEDTRSSWSVEPKPTQLKETSLDDDSVESPTKVSVSVEPNPNESLRSPDEDDVFKTSVDDKKQCIEKCALNAIPSGSAMDSEQDVQEESSENQDIATKKVETTSVWQVDSSFPKSSEELSFNEDSNLKNDSVSVDAPQDGHCPEGNKETSVWNVDKTALISKHVADNDALKIDAAEITFEDFETSKDNVEHDVSAIDDSKEVDRNNADGSLSEVSKEAATAPDSESVAQDNLVEGVESHVDSENDVVEECAAGDDSHNASDKIEIVSNSNKVEVIATEHLQNSDVTEIAMEVDVPSPSVKETNMNEDSQISFDKEINQDEDSQISFIKETNQNEDSQVSFNNETNQNEDSPISYNKETNQNEDSLISFTKEANIDDDSQISPLKESTMDEVSKVSEGNEKLINEDSQLSELKDNLLDENSQIDVSKEMETDNIESSINKSTTINEDSQISIGSPKSTEEISDVSKSITSQSILRSKQPIAALDEESQSSVISQKSQSSQKSQGSQKSAKRLRFSEDNVNGIFPPENLFEYMWPQENGEFFILQEQICDYLNVKSFKRKYPDLVRRSVDMDEKQFLKEKGVVTEMQCDLGLTALRSEEVLELMSKDYPDHYKEYIKVLRDKETQSITEKHKEFVASNSDKTKMVDLVKKAMQSAAEYNAHLNQERREERRSCMDLQTYTIHYPAKKSAKPKPTTKPGKYPVALLPGQFQDYYKQYTPNELKYLPVNTVLYGPLKELQSTKALSDGSQSDSDDSSVSEGSCSSSQGTHDDSSSSSEKNDNAKVSSEKNGISEGAYHSKVKPNAICKVCKKGPEGKDGKTEELVHCAECDNSAHPSCIELTSDVVDVLKTYPWQCMDCKVCSHCSDPNDEDKMLFCDLCDRGYHTFCVGLKSLPQGKWVCRRCGSCSICGATKPGPETSKAQWLYDSSRGVVELDANRRPKIMCQSCFKKKR